MAAEESFLMYLIIPSVLFDIVHPSGKQISFGCLFSTPHICCVLPHNFYFFVIFLLVFSKGVWILHSVINASRGLVLLFSMSTTGDCFSLLKRYLSPSHMAPTSCILGIINQCSTWQATIPIMYLYQVCLTLKHV